MNPVDTLFVGVNGYLAAFCKRDGAELWRTKLREDGLVVGGHRFVTVLAEGERVYAHTYGRLFCLDADTGEKLWENELAGLGYDLAMLAVIGASSPPLPALVERRREIASDSGGGTS